MSNGVFRPRFFLPPRLPSGLLPFSKLPVSGGGTSPPFMLIGQNGTYFSRIV
jgi:hypothetical protein